jgi:hypothetical protein
MQVQAMQVQAMQLHSTQMKEMFKQQQRDMQVCL